jgi:hypothetical protein
MDSFSPSYHTAEERRNALAAIARYSRSSRLRTLLLVPMEMTDTHFDPRIAAARCQPRGFPRGEFDPAGRAPEAGHASVAITEKHYTRWIPRAVPAVHQLDDAAEPIGSKAGSLVASVRANQV